MATVTGGPRFALKYDLRAPEFGQASSEDLLAAAVEQCAWADRMGFERVLLMEHHGSEDGYLPAPIVLAGAIAARTQRLGIRFSALITPLYHPLRLAEDLAVLDLLSHGRVEVVLGLGYAVHEAEMFDVPIRGRRATLERTIDVLRQAWTGEPFEYEGRQVQVTPRPAQRGGPPLLIGGSAEGGARRAGRFDMGFYSTIPDRRLWEVYREAMAEAGHADPGPERPRHMRFFHVSHDPEAAWARIAPHALHESASYSTWMARSAAANGNTVSSFFPDQVPASAEPLRADGVYSVLTPDEAVALLAGLADDTLVILHPLMGGMDPDLSWESLELLEHEVLPRLGTPVGAAR